VQELKEAVKGLPYLLLNNDVEGFKYLKRFSI